MNKDKLQNYNLTASIHTINVRSRQPPVIHSGIANDVLQSCYLDRTELWATKVNPNKIYGDIFAYSEFLATVKKLFDGLQVTEFTYYRTDIRLDSYEDNFKHYYKLNLLLINLFSLLFNDSNSQAVGHILTQSKEFCDISTQNQYWGVKYYNKKFQTNDEDPAKARLEFRSLKTTKIGGHPPHEVKAIWFDKLDRLPKLYEELQKKCNQALLGAYKAYCNYNSKSSNKSDHATAFLSNYSNSMTIYTRKQLREFLQLCGLSKKASESRAENIIGKVNIEFFSRADIERYIAKIKAAMDRYFDC